MGTITSADARAAGVSRALLRGSMWEKRGRGLYRPAGIGADPADEYVADALTLLTDGSALGGWAALRIQGNTMFDGRIGPRQRRAMVHCGDGSQMRRRLRVEPFRGELRDHEYYEIEGFRIATLARAAYDEMRIAPDLQAAVVVADMAVSRVHQLPHTSLDTLGRLIDSHHKTRGVVQARRAIALSSDRSASPLETKTRMIAHVEAGLTRLLVNVPIFDRCERLLGIADLLDEACGLVIETDGAHHRDAHHHTDDNVREEKFERAGLVVVRATAIDLQDTPRLVNRIMAARSDAAASPRRDWTLERPDWWSSWQPGRRWS